VQNIGFGADATHTTYAVDYAVQMPAWDGDAALLDKAPSAICADSPRDRIDEQVWAAIGWRPVLLKYFPWLSSMKRWVTGQQRGGRAL
jgi:hypothetical protein